MDRRIRRGRRPPRRGRPGRLVADPARPIQVGSIGDVEDTKATWGIYYTRLVARIPGSNALLLGIGDGTPGTTTRIFRSDDLARTWVESTFDEPAGSTVWAVGTHPEDPDLVFAGTKYGDLFRSTDGGRGFTKEWRQFPEITDVAWTPAVAAAPPAAQH